MSVAIEPELTDAFPEATGPMAYIWQRGRQTLYVGGTKYGLRRLRNHEIVKPEVGDRVLMLPVDTHQQALALEQQLIDKLDPLMNKIRRRSLGNRPLGPAPRKSLKCDPMVHADLKRLAAHRQTTVEALVDQALRRLVTEK